MIMSQITPELLEPYADLWVEAMQENPEMFTHNTNEILGRCESLITYPTNLKLMELAAANAEFLVYLLQRLSRKLRPASGDEDELELYEETRDKLERACSLATRIARKLETVLPEESIEDLYKNIWDQLGVKL